MIDSLCNLAIENGNPICVRNIEGHIASQHTVANTIQKVKEKRSPRLSWRRTYNFKLPSFFLLVKSAMKWTSWKVADTWDTEPCTTTYNSIPHHARWTGSRTIYFLNNFIPVCFFIKEHVRFCVFSTKICLKCHFLATYLQRDK